MERGEDKAAEFCAYLLLFAGAKKSEIFENSEIAQEIGDISKYFFLENLEYFSFFPGISFSDKFNKMQKIFLEKIQKNLRKFNP